MHASVSVCFVGLDSYGLLKSNPDIILNDTDKTMFCAHMRFAIFMSKAPSYTFLPNSCHLVKNCKTEFSS